MSTDALAAAPAPIETKTCPDCAERVQAAAKVCRFCSYRFDTAQSGVATAAAAAHTPGRKSPGGAVLLGFVFPGLGHLYLNEWWRAGAFLICQAFSVFAAFATGTFGLLLPLTVPSRAREGRNGRSGRRRTPHGTSRGDACPRPEFYRGSAAAL